MLGTTEDIAFLQVVSQLKTLEVFVLTSFIKEISAELDFLYILLD